jgi:hypothetical protein
MCSMRLLPRTDAAARAIPLGVLAALGSDYEAFRASIRLAQARDRLSLGTRARMGLPKFVPNERYCDDLARLTSPVRIE